MNLLITTNCNNNCSYCFVMQHQKMNMDIDQIDYLLSFPDFKNLDKVNILGGEPTLHPFLPEIIAKIRAANSHAVIQLFSHCRNDSTFLESIECNGLILVANCFDTRDELNVKHNLNVARKKGWTIVLSYTIAEKNVDIENIINFCNEEKIRIVRWSLAMPAYGTDNTYVPKSSYSNYLKDIEVCNKKLLLAKIAPYNDCPLPVCKNKKHYSTQENVYTEGIRYGVCHPPYDIYPDYSVTGCMGIGNRIHFNLRNVRSVKELETEYNKQVNNLRNARRLSTECQQCQKCDGGCFGFY